MTEIVIAGFQDEMEKLAWTRVALPAIGGTALGGLIGGLSAPERDRLEAALAGAGIGAMMGIGAGSLLKGYKSAGKKLPKVSPKKVMRLGTDRASAMKAQEKYFEELIRPKSSIDDLGSVLEKALNQPNKKRVMLKGLDQNKVKDLLGKKFNVRG